MRAVRHDDGRRLVLENASGDTVRVFDPRTGEREHVPAAACTPLDDAPLAVAAERVEEAARSLVTAVPDDQALGLLVVLADDGPLSVRTLLDRTTYCESDLHGLLVHFVAAGLLTEDDDAERAYAVTETTRTALDRLQ
jgi:hypothetical protein